jgi:hypothetical protein
MSEADKKSSSSKRASSGSRVSIVAIQWCREASVKVSMRLIVGPIHWSRYADHVPVVTIRPNIDLVSRNCLE